MAAILESAVAVLDERVEGKWAGNGGIRPAFCQHARRRVLVRSRFYIRPTHPGFETDTRPVFRGKQELVP